MTYHGHMDSLYIMHKSSENGVPGIMNTGLSLSGGGPFSFAAKQSEL